MRYSPLIWRPTLDYRNIILERDDGIATIRLNRPDALNALNSDLLEEFIDAIVDVGGAIYETCDLCHSRYWVGEEDLFRVRDENSRPNP